MTDHVLLKYSGKLIVIFPVDFLAWIADHYVHHGIKTKPKNDITRRS